MATAKPSHYSYRYVHTTWSTWSSKAKSGSYMPPFKNSPVRTRSALSRKILSLWMSRAKIVCTFLVLLIISTRRIKQFMNDFSPGLGLKFLNRSKVTGFPAHSQSFPLQEHHSVCMGMFSYHDENRGLSHRRRTDSRTVIWYANRSAHARPPASFRRWQNRERVFADLSSAQNLERKSQAANQRSSRWLMGALSTVSLYTVRTSMCKIAN